MKKAFVFLGLAAVMGNVAYAADENKTSFTRSFMEENDLWKEDGLFDVPNVSKEAFEKIVAAGLELYKPFADKNNEKLVINPRWDDPTVNANCSRRRGLVTVNMFGGLARRPEVNPQGFALVLCHELGHAYGGKPFIDVGASMAAEGQADYYGASACLEKVIEKVGIKAESADAIPPYAVQKCHEKFGRGTSGYDMCITQMTGAKALGNLLATLKKEAEPQFETPDPLVVKETELSYPSTVQCRMDTYHNGIFGMERPACWFKPGSHMIW